jgi:hypothetical protein
MAKPRMDLPAFVGKLLEEQDGDVLREGVRVLAQALSVPIPSTQDPERRKSRVGSIPSSGTSKSISFIHLRRTRLQTVPCAKTAVGQPWGNSRRNCEAGQGGPTAQRPSAVWAERRSRQAGQALQPAGRRCAEYRVLVGRLRPLGGEASSDDKRRYAGGLRRFSTPTRAPSSRRRCSQGGSRRPA